MKNDRNNKNSDKNILDILLDAENREPVTLWDGDDRKITFEQVAVIPHDGKIYCVMKPLEHLDGVADDEALVLYVDIYRNEVTLNVELNQLKAIEVFEKYYDLLEKSALKKEGDDQ